MERNEYWDRRAVEIEDDRDVNITDRYQRELEHEQIAKFLKRDMTVLDVGCGNGYSTNYLAKFVDTVVGFDLSWNMIERARQTYEKTNLNFYKGNIDEDIKLIPEGLELLDSLNLLHTILGR